MSAQRENYHLTACISGIRTLDQTVKGVEIKVASGDKTYHITSNGENGIIIQCKDFKNQKLFVFPVNMNTITVQAESSFVNSSFELIDS